MCVCDEWMDILLIFQNSSEVAPETILHGKFLAVSDRSAAAEDDVSLRGLVAGNSTTPMGIGDKLITKTADGKVGDDTAWSSQFLWDQMIIQWASWASASTPQPALS